ncbi:helix-turn-helix transcriptional regulator [Nocardiopsis sp. NPDC058631]|uniref:helix-turn-helix transcriptional regulator n=1 Tax=Nocardiopsis sp. NPDC058631 TaxID=3346566 RepID=UPI0036479B70
MRDDRSAVPDHRLSSHGGETIRAAEGRLVGNGHPRPVTPPTVPSEAARYRETRITDGSSPFVCVWNHRVGPGPQRVVPDNHADFIVSSTGLAWLVGPATSADLPEFEPGTVLNGLRIHTACLRPVTGVGGVELRDRKVAVDDLLPARRARRLVELLRTADVRPSDLHALWPDVEVDARVREAVRLLSEGGPRGVDAVAGEVSLTPRHLRRLTERETGLSPKVIQQVGRLQRALRLMRADGPRALADVAASVGYADQSHLTHEVRRFTGRTPRSCLGPGAEER